MDARAQIMAQKKAQKSQYNKLYYQKHKKDKKEKYNAQVQYVRWVDVKKTLSRHKRKIGNINYDLLMDELSKLEITRYG